MPRTFQGPGDPTKLRPGGALPSTVTPAVAEPPSESEDSVSDDDEASDADSHGSGRSSPEFVGEAQLPFSSPSSDNDV